MKRKAYRLKAGNIKNLKLIEEELPKPAPSEVRVRIKAIGLNFADVFAIWGLYSATPSGEFIPGLEYSGIIEMIGADVTNVKVGEEVMGVTRFGAYTTHLNIDSRYVIPLPKSWDFSTGAAYLVQVLTAYYALLYLGQLKKGQNVLIHSAAGGVGILANRICKKYGCFTIGTVGGAHKLDKLKAEGYNQGIVRGDDFRKQLLKALDGRDLHLIMECIGGEIFNIGFDVLAPQGRTIVYGAASYAHPGDRPNYLKIIWKYLRRPKLDVQSLPEINKGVLGFNLIYLYEQADLMYELLDELKDLGIEKPIVGHTFPFEELPDAIRVFKEGNTIGKVVIKVD